MNGILCLVFAVFALLSVKDDLSNYIKRPIDKNYWLYLHISRMMGGNVAAFTAFLVVNNKILPWFVAWLLPTIIVIPLSVYYINRLKNQLNTGKTAKELVTIKIDDAEDL